MNFLISEAHAQAAQGQVVHLHLDRQGVAAGDQEVGDVAHGDHGDPDRARSRPH